MTAMTNRAIVQPRRTRAVQIIASMCPPIGISRRAETLYIELEGEVGSAHDGKGIFAAPIEVALRRHASASHVEVTINSLGGFVDEAFRIYKVLRAAGETAHLTTVAGRVCASAATIVLMAGELRLAESAGSRILLHQAEVVPRSKGGRWTADQHARAAQRIRSTNEKIVALFAERCGNRRFFEREFASESPLPLWLAKAQNVVHCIAGEERWQAGRPYYS